MPAPLRRLSAASASRHRPSGRLVPAVLLAVSLVMGNASGALAAGTSEVEAFGTGGSAAGGAAVGAQDGSLPRLQRLLTAIARGYPVGTVAEVRGPGAGEWSAAAGRRRLGPAASRSARPDDRFRIASVTKPMIATLVMQEVARGRWTLDTPMSQVFPHLLKPYDAVTVRQLLSHTSGLPDFLAALVGDVNTLAEFRAIISRRYTNRQLVRAALTLEPTGAPGAAFSYSNTNYVVLGIMLKRATGQSLQTLLRRRVFARAGMDDSAFDTTPGIWGGHLTEYARIGMRLRGLQSFDPTMFSAAGAVVSTTDDVNRFWRALYRGRLVRPQLVDRMLRPVSSFGYGLGVYALPDPCTGPDGSPRLLYGHDGASFGTRTMTFSSRDARRQVTLAWTGRDLAGQDPTSTAEFMVAAFESTCPAGSYSATARDARRRDQLVDEFAQRLVDARRPVLVPVG